MAKPTQIFYDIEIFPHDFTFGMLNEQKKVVSVYSVNTLIKHDLKEIERLVQKEYPDYKVNIINGRSLVSWQKTAFAFSKNYYSSDPVEWLGWNSTRYDLMLMSVFFVYLDHERKILSPSHLRELSDRIILDEARYPKRFFQEVAKMFRPNYELSEKMKDQYYKYLNGLLHIDVGTLNEKSRNNRAGEVFPFSLKEVSAYLGLDVLDDPITSVEFKGWTAQSWNELTPDLKERIDKQGALTKKGLVETIVYNIRDIINTAIIFKEPEYIDELQTKDKLRAMFPFITTDPTGRDSFHQINRDATSVQFSGKIIRGKDRVKLKDIPKISFDYPLPNGETVNLLEHAYDNEHVHFNMKMFYNSFKDRDMSSQNQYNSIVDNSYTGKSTLNIPYMDKDEKATSSFITLSVGGAHGTVADDLYGKNMKDYPMWLVEKGKQSLSSDVFTLDIENVIHVDVKSYYPNLNKLLGVFKGESSKDYYANLLDTRFEIQGKLRALQAKEDTRTEEQARLDAEQNALKLVLNSGTGGGNTFSKNNPYADLPVDNATISMRMIGNILIYILGQRLTVAGALVISTNTDGLHLTNIEIEETKAIVEQFEEDYGLQLDVSMIDRFISRNTNERIEIVDGEISDVAGDLRRSIDNTPSPYLKRNRQRFDGFPNFPKICGRAVLDYFKNNPDWLNQAIISTSALRNILEGYRDEDFFALDWVHVLKGNRRRVYTYTMEGDVEKRLQATNRIVMTKDKHKIVEHFDESERKITGLTSNHVQVVNSGEELWNIDREKIDIDAYAQWASNLASNWLKNGSVPELDIGEPPIEQVSLFDLYNQ